MTTDMYGYLWICTDKGVVRYNGYESRLFNLSDGLPTEDVWELLVDKKGRVWLGNMSDEVGYIYNNKYHKAYLKDIKGAIFPYHINTHKDGIIFSTFFNSEGSTPRVCYERNDTVFSYVLRPALFNDTVNVFCDVVPTNNNTYILRNGCTYQLFGFDNASANQGKVYARKLACSEDWYKMNYYTNCVIYGIGDYLVAHNADKKSHAVILMNVISGKVDSIDVRDYNINDPIEYVNYSKSAGTRQNEVFVYTKKNILHFDINPVVKHIKTYYTGGILDNEKGDKKVVSLIKNSLWGTCIGTNTNGSYLFIDREKSPFKKIDLELQGYSFVGGNTDQVLFWWNPNTRTLAKVVNNAAVGEYTLPMLHTLRKVVYHNKDTFLILGSDTYFFNQKSGDIQLLNGLWYGTRVVSVCNYDSDRFFFVSQFGVFAQTRKSILSGNPTPPVGINRAPYTGLVYDTVRKKIWAYGNSKILIYGDERKKIIEKQELQSLGISVLESVSIDGKYGNVFLQGTNKLFYYDVEKNSCKELFKDINLKYARVNVYGSILVVSGSFGILFCKLSGKGIFSEPVIYFNSKKAHYKRLNEFALCAGHLILDTDNGFFEVSLPSDSEFYAQKPESRLHILLVNYDGATRALHKQDTLVVNQKDRKLLFDVINPNGTGKLVFNYKKPEDSRWYQLNSNELNIPEYFVPDNYYKLSIYASDDDWKGVASELTVYIKPYWWQTHTAVRFIWVGAVMLAILIIVVAIFVTRRIVLKASERRNLQMEMELKSIYAQINPHFIFNSLNSALLLVSKNQMDEAYAHISKFSRLLRSYLRSSRNKYITIGEEAVNLKNYVELQQTRFKNKFSYEMNIDPAIDQDSMKIPSLLLQPFVENAINHGILEKPDTGFVKIEFRLRDRDEIVCTIEDDGIGRKQSRHNKTGTRDKEESYGDLMIKDLINIFNKYEDMQIDIAYTDKEIPATGTIVTITIKNPKHE